MSPEVNDENVIHCPECGSPGGCREHVVSDVERVRQARLAENSREGLHREIERLKAALSGVLEICRRPDEGYVEPFERINEMYYRDTGYQRPGKSEPLETGRDSSSKENCKRFDEWYDNLWRGRWDAARRALEEK